jgi:hypothetical protein
MAHHPLRQDRLVTLSNIYTDLHGAAGLYDPQTRQSAAAQQAQQRDDELSRYIARKVEAAERAAAAVVDAARLADRFILNCRQLYQLGDAQIRDALYSDVRVRLAAYAGPLAIAAQLDAAALHELHCMCRYLRCAQVFGWPLLGIFAFSDTFRRAAAELEEPDWLVFLEHLEPMKLTLDGFVAAHRLPWEALLNRQL